MTRRGFLATASGAGLFGGRAEASVTLPLHLIQDGKAKWRPKLLRDFWWTLWPDTVHEFERCGVRFQTTFCVGEVRRPDFREPVITPLDRRAVNLAITDRIPSFWDNGRNLAGVTTLHRGYHLCMIALAAAHGNEIPLFSVNTCVHELLHAILGDIFENRAAGLSGQARESRIDWYATRLWLLHDGKAIREAARTYAERLRAQGLQPFGAGAR